MKKLKRVLAVLLTAIMTLAMATTAFAAENQGSLKVTVNQGNTLNGQTIKVYKLFDLTVSGAHYAYTVNEQYKEMIATALGLETGASSEALYNKLVGFQENHSEIQEFADDFTAAALTNNIDATGNSEKLGDVTDYTFNSLAFGYYLVYQTGTKEIQSSLVSVDKVGETTVALKGQAPSIEKTADKETVEIGQVVTYTINGVIPDTTGYDSYVYKIHDTLTDGLDFVEDTQGKLPEGNNYNVSVQIAGGEAEIKTATLSRGDKRTMELDLSQWIRDNQTANKGKNFTVTYYAKVNEKAVVETKNSAKLEYGNEPGNTTMTTPSEVTTPTYPLDIKKTDTQSTLLAGAKFRLYKNEKDAKAANDNAIKVTGNNGNYTVAVDQKTEKNMDMVTLENEVASGYNLRLNGLAAGTYWLVEKEAPAGYNKLTAPIKVTITQNGDNKLEWTVSKNDSPEDDKIIDIKNTTGTILPGTGGMGTILFTVVGIALVLIVAASFVISRRKRA